MEDPEIIITEDGSHSLKLNAINEHYHSTHGAISESRHVFIESGLQKVLEEEGSLLNILEIGFGTGLNALLSLAESSKTAISVNYTAIEPFPVSEKIWGKLNYHALIGDKRAGEWYSSIHNCPWEVETDIMKGFTLLKHKCQLQDYNSFEAKFGLIFFDAFAPDIQPELWTDEIFQKIAGITVQGGVFVTYSAKGSVRRALQNAGFRMERLPGPKGKREMLRGMRL
ncbi:MAG TPA: tRNA (5-methylaminomethyl-2-thiouridine)(34)-methyltransferase MnmD [Bacteroidales bacterium]|nr:tRNA (5-methylaminomethyl-2-thiouridine)(34)-methyltransferase MnmD [Bacteroidales bacterium]